MLHRASEISHKTCYLFISSYFVILCYKKCNNPDCNVKLQESDTIKFRHYSDVTWTSWHLKSPTPRQLSLRLSAKKTLKLRITGPLWGESTGHRWWPVDSPYKGPVMNKALPCYDVIIRVLLFQVLCAQLYPKRVVFLSDVDGFYSRPPEEPGTQCHSSKMK